MKLLTCNSHSIIEKDYDNKLKYFAQWILDNDYDVIAVQESNQTHDAKAVVSLENCNYISSNENIVIKEDNHIFNLIKYLNEKGQKYYWTWTPIKIGYGIFDEGIGVLSKYKPLEIKEFYLSNSKAYDNYKVRKAIGIKVNIDGKDKWFYSVHAGWWNDLEEPFKMQLSKLNKRFLFEKDEVYLMGDFNNPADIEDEGYTALLQSGWHDTYRLADKKDNGITVSGLIDGWREHKIDSMRIDLILKNKNTPVKESTVVFNNLNGKQISDHFAVEIIE